MTTVDTREPGFGTRLREWVLRDTTAGILLIVAAAIGLIWANTPWREAYTALSETGVPTELVLYPDASHVFVLLGRPSQRLDVNRRTHRSGGQHGQDRGHVEEGHRRGG